MKNGRGGEIRTRYGKNGKVAKHTGTNRINGFNGFSISATCRKMQEKSEWVIEKDRNLVRIIFYSPCPALEIVFGRALDKYTIGGDTCPAGLWRFRSPGVSIRPLRSPARWQACSIAGCAIGSNLT